MVDGFGAFKVRLATMHHVVAKERCAIEMHVSTVRREVIASTPVLVATAGTLFRPNAMREVCGDAGTLEILLIDEATRTTKFEVDMSIAAVSSVLDENTRVALIGDPCQTKTTLRTLRCTTSLQAHAQCSLSTCREARASGRGILTTYMERHETGKQASEQTSDCYYLPTYLPNYLHTYLPT